MPKLMVRQEQPPCQSLSVHLLPQHGAEMLLPHQLNQLFAKLLHGNNSHQRKWQILAYRSLEQIKNNMKRQTRVFCVCVNSRVFSLPSPLSKEGGHRGSDDRSRIHTNCRSAPLCFYHRPPFISTKQHQSEREREKNHTF